LFAAASVATSRHGRKSTHRSSLSYGEVFMPPTHDKTGRAKKKSGDIGLPTNPTTTRIFRRNKIAGQFAPRLIEMLESPAFCVLSLSGRRILDRLEIELAHHGGYDNGVLPVTLDNFQDYGVDRHAIAPAIREVEALGFAQVMERGRAGNADYRTSNKFWLTYRPTGRAAQTDEWRRIKTFNDAKAIAREARKPIKRTTPIKDAAKCKKPVGVITHFSVGNPHRKVGTPTVGIPHYGLGGETPTTLDISGGDGQRK
jgi:hypothetical protein